MQIFAQIKAKVHTLSWFQFKFSVKIPMHHSYNNKRDSKFCKSVILRFYNVTTIADIAITRIGVGKLGQQIVANSKLIQTSMF